MAYGDGDIIRELSENQCEKQNVRCAACSHLYYRCYAHDECPRCGEKRIISIPWHYGMPIPGGGIHGKTLLDGQKVIPRFFVEVRAFLNPHPNGDSLSSWAIAEAWFRDNGGWRYIENKEWYSYSKRILKDGTLYFGKEE